MAAKGSEMGVILIFALVAMLCHEATAQTGCTMALISMSPCINYISGNASTPSPSCCSQLASVVQSQPQCLCSALNGGGSSLGLTINQTQALALPGACNVKTPSVSRCNDVNGQTTTPASSPVSSPASSPSRSSNEAPATPASSSVPTVSSGTRSKTVPTTSSTSSGRSINEKPLHLSAFLLLISAVASILTVF